MQTVETTTSSPNSTNAVLAAVPLPCPFCGCSDDPVKNNTRVFHGAKGRYEEVDYYLECDGCGLVMGNDRNHDQWGDVVCDYSTPEEALKVWNSRHGS